MATFFYNGISVQGSGDGSTSANASNSTSAAIAALSTGPVEVTAGTFTLSAAETNGKSISGAGNVAVTAIDQTLSANLSGITVSGTKTGAFSGTGTFTGNFGSLNISVDGGATLTSTSTILNAVPISGAGSVAVSDTVSVAQATSLDGTIATALTLSSISDSLANLASNGSASSGLLAITVNQPDVVVTITDATGTLQANDLSAVGGATTGTVTVSNAQTVTGTTAQVTAALVTDATEVVLAAASTATVTDAATAAQGQAIAGVNNVTANFSGGISDTLSNLASGGSATTALNAVVADDTNVVITITDATGTLQANDLSAVGGATTGTVTVSNAQTVTGTTAQVTAALVTDATEVVLAAASTATVTDAATAAQGQAIAGVNNVTANFSGGISDTLSNLASGGSATTALNAVVADDTNVVITITDATGTLQADNLSAVGDATTGTVTVSNAQTVIGTTDQVIAAVLTESSKVTLNAGSTINASGYTNQDLSGIDASFTLNVTTADPAVLDSAKLATADSITIGTGSATIDAASTDEVALAAKTTVNDGTTLTVNNYVDTDLSGLSNQGSGSIVVNTTSGAVLDETKLADATSVVLGVPATGAASAIDGIGTNGSRINLNGQTLSVSGYLSENLSGITGDGTVNITTANGAQLVASNLTTADSVTVVETNTVTAADADALGSRLTGTGTVNITTDPITANTDLSDLGSVLTLQFNGDTSVAVNGTLTVRQDQVSGYTITGTGTVAAAGTASADSFDASGISATLNLTSLAANDSITVAPANLDSTDSIDGGDNTDTLIFSAATTSVVDVSFTNVTNTEILQLANGTNSISLGSEAENSGAGITTVTGGTDADTLNLLYGTTNLTFNAGTGSDTLSYSADSETQLITLSSNSSGVASGTVTNDGTDTFTGLEAIVGGSGSSDLITSTNSAETLVVNGTNAGTIDGFAFSGVESVNLGLGNDTANINDGGSLTGNLNLGDGTDILNYTSYGNAVSATLSGADSISSMTAIGGGVTGVENLTLSANNDTLTIATGATLSGNIDFGVGNDTLSYAGYNGVVTVSLDSATSAAASDATGISGTISSVETLIGGNGSNDTLNANAGANTLIVAANSTATLDTNLTVSGFETFNLGSGNDTVTINDGGSVAGLIGGDNNDTLNLDGAANSITITGTGEGSTAGTTFTGFETVNGLGGSDAFIVNSASSSTITLAGGGDNDSLSVAASDSSGNSLTISGSGSGSLSDVTFSEMESITLGSGGDDANINSGGSLSGNLNLGDGANSISFNTGAGSIGSVRAGSGSDSVNITAGSITGALDLGTGTDSLSYAGYGSAVSVTLSGSNALSSSTAIGAGVSGVENVTLSSNNDTFTVADSGSLSGNLALGSGSDTLSYSGYTNAVTVSLNSATSTAAGGATAIDGTVSSFENLVGGNGSDTLNASSGVNTLSVAADGITSLDTSLTVSGFETIYLGSGSDSVTLAAQFNGSIDAGAGDSDVLNLNASANDVTLTSAGTGSWGTTNFSNFEVINLLGGADTFTINSSGSITSVNGGDSTDTLDYSGYGSGVTVNLASGTATGTGAISGFETVLGSNNADTITAPTSGDVTFQGNGGNDTFRFTVNGLTSGDTVVGGSGTDGIVFTDAGTIGDAQFTNVTEVESVSLTAASTISLGAEAKQATIANITAGNGATTVNSTVADYDLTVNATSLGDGTSLTLTGSASSNDFTVTDFNGSLLASGTSGNLTVNTVNAGDNAIGVTTGSGNTTISGSGSNDTVTVNAAAMADNTTLDINGSATFTVSNLEANTDAAGSSGTVNLAYTDVSDQAATITTGSGATTVSGTTADDTVSINAASLAQNTTLTESGAANQVVTNLVGDVSATALTGTLTVTTGDAVDNGIGITTGSNNTTITANGSGDTVTVNAAAMADNTTLDLNGSATFSVSNLEADANSADTTGSVSLVYSNVTDPGSAATITTGSGATSVTGVSGDTLTIDATQLANDTSLSLYGQAEVVVSALRGDVNAGTPVSYSDDFSSLNGWTGGALDTSVGYYGSFLGRYANGTKTNGQDTFKTFALAGQPATISFDVHRIDSWDGEAFRAYVNDTVAFQTTFVQGQNINAQSGSTNGFSWTITPKDTRALRGFAGWDEQTATVMITVPVGLPSLKLGFGSGLDQGIDDESYGIDNLSITSSGGTLSGPLTITTADNTVDDGISISSGSANTTINANGSGDTITVNADAMADNTTLDLNGSASYTVSNLEANTDAADTSGSVNLAYTDVSDSAASITTGSGATTVSGTTSGDTLTINAASLSQNTTLTESGAANQVVTNLVGDISATALTGTLTVSTGDAGDNGIGITTGSNNTTITANGSGDTVSVNADAMVDNTTLDLNGSATYTVSNLEANTDAAGTSGSVNLAYTDVTDSAASITTGSGATTVSGTTSGDTLTINAASLAQNTTLTESGDADQVVTNLVGDINATALTGTLTVTTGDAVDNGIGITTGSNNTTITANGSGDTVTVNADAMADNTTLDLNGSATYTVSNLEANTDAAGTSGTVNLAYTDVSDNAATITTGSGATTVSGTTADDTLTINAASLSQNTTLTESGAANQVVTNLVGDISATALTGTLTVSTADAGDGGIGITTGSNNTTITANGSGDTVSVNADAMADNTTLDLNGSATYTVSNLEANTDAAGSTGSLTIAYSDVSDGHATLITGSGNVVVTGGDASDTVTVTGLNTNDQTFTSQTSSSNFNITAGANNQTITASNTGSDTIDSGSGYDTLSYAGGNKVDVTITSFATQSGGSTGQGTDTFTGIESLVGATGTDTLRGIEGSSDEIATITSADAGDLANAASTGRFDFSSFEQIDLNAGNDVLALSGNGSLSSSADGGVGTDRLDYTGYTASSVTVNLNTNTATAIAGDLVGVNGDSSFEDIYGSAYSDTLTGDQTANLIRGYDGGDTILGLDGNDTLDGGDGTNGPDGADAIAGGDGVDLILASDGSDFISGGSYTEAGGEYTVVNDQSIDTLSYADENEGLDITLDGTDTGMVLADANASLSISTITSTYSSSGDQTISVPTNQVSTDWTDLYGDIQNLVLTGQNDIVRFSDTSDLNTGSIDAGGGSLDTLDYSSFDAQSTVIVNLSSSSYSFDFDANGTIDTSIGEITISNAFSATNINLAQPGSEGGANGISNFEVVIGGAADDAIVGNSSDNLLVGNDGDDRIAGGDGADTIYGGAGDDYIVPGEGADTVYAGAGINTLAITSSDLVEDTFFVDSNGINIFKLEGDGSQTTSITAPTGDWNPGARGIDLLDGGDPVITGSGPSAVTTYDTIEGTASDDNYEFGGTAFKNIGDVDLGAGDDSVGTAATTKGIKVAYDGNTGTDSITLNFTFDQFAKLNASGLYVADVQNYLDNATGETFSSSQADFTATNFESGGVAVITPGVYNALQGDPAALTFNTAYGVRNSTISVADDVNLAASALTTSTATALSAPDIVSAFVQASGVKGSDAISITTGGSISGSTTASQDASALARTVDDRADSVLSAYALGTDRSSFSAGDTLTLTLAGTVNADTTAESAGFVANATGTLEAAGSRDSSLSAADALAFTISASGQQSVAAANVAGLAIAALASRAYGIDDANLTDAASDSVQAGADLNLQASASSNSRVSAQTVGNEALGTFTLVDNGAAATDRFTISQTGADFPLINGDRVRFNSSNGSVQADRDYYVLNVIPVTGEFQLSSEPDGSPVDVVAAGTLQAYRPATATADAISTVTAVDLNRTGGGVAGVQAGEGLSLSASATDLIKATATSVAGDATAGVFRLGGFDGLNLPAAVSMIQALADTQSLAAADASLQLSASDTVTLTATSTEGSALTEVNVQVTGSQSSDSSAGGDLSVSSTAGLSLEGTATSTSGTAEARSGAGAGAGVTTPGTTANDTGAVQPSATSYAEVVALDNGSQIAGSDLTIQANASSSLMASAGTVDGSNTLANLWTSAAGNVLATFDLNADTTTTTPSFIGPHDLADGQLVQLPADAAGLLASTDYAVKLLGFGAVDAAADRLTMPTGVTYASNDAVRFRLNSTTPLNSAESRYDIALGSTYYVVNVSGTTFQLSASPGGPVIDLSDDSIGAADQLVDADRFQLLTPPAAPGGSYSIAPLAPSVSGVALTLPAVANAFAGSREADRTLTANDSIALAQVRGISGNAGLRSLQGGGDAAINAVADGVVNASAHNVASDATASTGMVAEGISDMAITAGSGGTIRSTARIDALADAVTAGDSATLDNSLANLNITARGLSAGDAANTITIAGSGDVALTATLSGRSSASSVNGASDALAVLEASGLEALTPSFSASIAERGDIRADASIGSLAAPLIIRALSSAEGDATAQAAANAVGILGSYTVPADFSSLQAGSSQGDISGRASADLVMRASATNGDSAVSLSDVAGGGRATIAGIENMALSAGAGFSGVDASAVGRAELASKSVGGAAASQASTSTSGLFSSGSNALPVVFADSGRIAAIAQQSTFAQSVSVNGTANSMLNNTSVGIGNAMIVISGVGTLDARALSQLESRSHSVSGAASA